MAVPMQSYLKEEVSTTDTLVHNATTDNADTQHILQNTTGYSSSAERFPDDPVSSATAQFVLTVVQVGILPVLTLGGVIMNLTNMAVFVRQGLSDRINLCLFSLALSDTGYIAISMTSKMYSIFSLLDPALGYFWRMLSQVFVGLYMAFLATSSCLTLLISLERCVCVLWPLKARTLLSVRHIAGVIVFIFIMCTGGCGLVYVKNTMHTYWDPETNSTVYYRNPTRFYVENREVVDIIFDIIFTLSLPTICLLGVMMATVLISLRMRAVLSWRVETAHVGSDKTVTSSERREGLVTRMLMVVCAVFTVCTIPSVTHAFFRFYVPDFDVGQTYNNLFFLTICLVHTMATINASGNFLIYWTMSSKFRDTLRHLVTCCAAHAHGDSERVVRSRQ